MTNSPAVLVDACTAINLFATEMWAEIFAACELRPALSHQAAKESLWFIDETGERVRIALDAFRKAGHLEIWMPAATELSVLLELSVRLGEGEAACLAMAETRRMPLLTDDRAARREALARGLADNLWSTPGLLRRWQRSARPTAHELAFVLRRVRTGASYIPGAEDPDRAWWDAHDLD